MNKKDKLTKYIYNIGDFVNVKAFVEFGYDAYGKRGIDRREFEDHVQCQVVGAKHIAIGTFSSINDSAWDEQPSYYNILSVEGTVFVWEVKQGLLNSIKFALPGDIYLPNLISVKYPIFYNKQPKWPKEALDYQRKAAKDMPRDKKGRFMR